MNAPANGPWVIVLVPESGDVPTFFRGPLDHGDGRHEWTPDVSRALYIKRVEEAVPMAGILTRALNVHCLPLPVDAIPLLRVTLVPGVRFIVREWPEYGERWQEANRRLEELRWKGYLTKPLGQIAGKDGVIIADHFYCVPREESPTTRSQISVEEKKARRVAR